MRRVVEERQQDLHQQSLRDNDMPRRDCIFCTHSPGQHKKH